MWGQGFGPAAELPLGVLRANQSDLPNCVFRGEVAILGDGGGARIADRRSEGDIRTVFDDGGRARRDRDYFTGSRVEPIARVKRVDVPCQSASEQCGQE